MDREIPPRQIDDQPLAEWWTKKDPAEPSEPPKRAILYLRNSADIGQEYSVENQREQLQAFADAHGIKIVQELSDRGKSGLTADGRPAFNELLDLARTRDDFDCVLTLDVSRWGRFQDADVAAHYESLCTQYGKQVIYSTLGMPGQHDILVLQLLKAVHRFQSADFLRKLSKDVFEGAMTIARKGFRPGAPPRYGFARLMLDEQRKPDRILEPGQRKGLAKGRTILVAGDPEKVRTVREIFTLRAERRLGDRDIAAEIDAQGTPPPGKSIWKAPDVRRVLSDEQYRASIAAPTRGRILALVKQGLEAKDIARLLREDGFPPPHEPAWRAGTIRAILNDEQYCGCVVYNKSQKKMKSKTRRNPRSAWVVTPDSYEPLISRELFEKAWSVTTAPIRRRQPAEMLANFRRLYETYGIVTPRMLQVDEACASPERYKLTFGGIPFAIQSLFQDVIDRIKRDIARAIASEAAIVDNYEDFLVVNRQFSLIVQPAVPIPAGYGLVWVFRPDRREVIDITLGVLLSDVAGGEVLGYVALPRLLVRQSEIRISSNSDSLIAMHGYGGLELIQALIQKKETSHGPRPNSADGAKALPEDSGGQGQGDNVPQA